ncbi:hypothetical protein BDY19DRAFT_858286, partial [Irpex rosettiformis]
RFRQVPTFGRDTIRRFSANVADLKKLGARDFEDILQCSIPVLEGLLLEPYNSTVLDLLWTLTTWHALAKLRMHTTTTLKHLTHTTTALGRFLRQFKEHVCTHFVTKELPRESAARDVQIRLASDTQASPSNVTMPSGAVPRVKTFNLNTYKLHALGDYVETIKTFGPSDNYSTQTVS